MYSVQGHMTSVVDFWHSINQDFLYGNVPPNKSQVKGADICFSVYQTDAHLFTARWDELEANSEVDHTWMYKNPQKRVDLLAKRYIQPDLYASAIERLDKIASRKSAYPTVVNMPFFRTKDAPSGGGCLMGITFVWWKKQMRVEFNLRASEVTKALMGDLYFFRWLLKEKISKDSTIGEKVDFEWGAKTSFKMTLATQSRVLSPLYLLQLGGTEEVISYMTNRSTEGSYKYALQKYFWTRFIYPEYHIKRAQTSKWVNTFLVWTNSTDWPTLGRSLGWEYKAKARSSS